eukprot:1390799-Alexandrium_andersonii.AAC.1
MDHRSGWPWTIMLRSLASPDLSPKMIRRPWTEYRSGFAPSRPLPFRPSRPSRTGGLWTC